MWNSDGELGLSLSDGSFLTNEMVADNVLPSMNAISRYLEQQFTTTVGGAEPLATNGSNNNER
jgi:hypothetical protein